MQLWVSWILTLPSSVQEEKHRDILLIILPFVCVCAHVCVTDQQQRQEVSERERRVTLLIAPPTPTSPSHHTHHTVITHLCVQSPVCLVRDQTPALDFPRNKSSITAFCWKNAVWDPTGYRSRAGRNLGNLQELCLWLIYSILCLSMRSTHTHTHIFLQFCKV